MNYKKLSVILAISLLSLSGCKDVEDNIETKIITEKAIPAIVTVTEAITEQTTTPTTVTTTITETTTEATTYNDISQIPSDYSKDFFSKDLFIGDSITTGFSGYGYISEENIYAKIGLNPISIFDTSVKTPEGELYIKDELAQKLPERVYIMLGSNGIQWLDNDKMIDSMSKMKELINENSKNSEIIILSVPPVTKSNEEKSDTADIMTKIADYNNSLKDFCSENDLQFIDITSMLLNGDGYFNDELAESDGMHFKGNTYKMVLSLIQRTIENNDQ